MYENKEQGIQVKVVREGRFMPRFRVVKTVRGQQVLLENPLHDTAEQAQDRALKELLR